MSYLIGARAVVTAEAGTRVRPGSPTLNVISIHLHPDVGGRFRGNTALLNTHSTPFHLCVLMAGWDSMLRLVDC